MHLQKIPLRSTHSFTDFFLKYMDRDPALESFYSHFPQGENFKDQLKDKASFPLSTRKVLVETLQRQYAKFLPRQRR